ncbi:MAG: hopanoid biosynthesis-associated protein HpnK [Rhodospirillales bacterium]|nr:hopanoid biosynthesis-associated protein HpnK [Rhodospirillales bacterium]
MTAKAKSVIVTGDDFGWNERVNLSIADAHRNGILGSASLMMTGGAVGQAVDLAKSMPDLRIGLHLAVTRSRPLLSRNELPTITDFEGRLGHDLTRAGFLYFFSLKARSELKREIRAQFAAFAETGLALDHVDVHNHMHLHPTVLGLLLKVGRDHGLKAVRLPYEPFSAISKLTDGNRLSLAVRWLLLMPWVMAIKYRLRVRSIRSNDRLFGIHHTGKVGGEVLKRMLRILPAKGLTEIHLHPGLQPSDNDPERDALTDPEVRELFDALHLHLTSYGAEAANTPQ